MRAEAVVGVAEGGGEESVARCLERDVVGFCFGAGGGGGDFIGVVEECPVNSCVSFGMPVGYWRVFLVWGSGGRRGVRKGCETYRRRKRL